MTEVNWVRKMGDGPAGDTEGEGRSDRTFAGWACRSGFGSNECLVSDVLSI